MCPFHVLPGNPAVGTDEQERSRVGMARLPGEDVFGDHHPLDFGRALVDLGRAHIAKEPFDDRAAAVALEARICIARRRRGGPPRRRRASPSTPRRWAAPGAAEPRPPSRSACAPLPDPWPRRRASTGSPDSWRSAARTPRAASRNRSPPAAPPRRRRGPAPRSRRGRRRAPTSRPEIPRPERRAAHRRRRERPSARGPCSRARARRANRR